MQLYLNSMLVNALMPVDMALFVGLLDMFSFEPDIRLIDFIQANCADVCFFFTIPFEKAGTCSSTR